MGDIAIHGDDNVTYCGGSGCCSCGWFVVQVAPSRVWWQHGENRIVDLRRLLRAASCARVEAPALFLVEMPRRDAGRDALRPVPPYLTST